LIFAERAWIAFRDAECKYKAMIAHGGTGESYVYVPYLYEQMKDQARTLMAPDESYIARQ